MEDPRRRRAGLGLAPALIAARVRGRAGIAEHAVDPTRREVCRGATALGTRVFETRHKAVLAQAQLDTDDASVGFEVLKEATRPGVVGSVGVQLMLSTSFLSLGFRLRSAFRDKAPEMAYDPVHRLGGLNEETISVSAGVRQSHGLRPSPGANIRCTSKTHKGQ